MKIFLWTVLSMLGWFAYMGYAAPSAQIAPGAIQANHIPDPYLAELATELGIPSDLQSKVKMEISNQCPATAGGCYDVSIKFTEKSMALNRDQQRALFGHEYLHWVWEAQLTEKEREVLGASLNAGYNQKDKFGTNLRERMGYWVTNHKLTPGTPDFTHELHSVIGTEVNDASMPPAVLEHYKKWLPNRHALPSYF